MARPFSARDPTASLTTSRSDHYRTEHGLRGSAFWERTVHGQCRQGNRERTAALQGRKGGTADGAREAS